MSNQLIHEQSPYLLQHAENPVDWMPWGDAAFERAKRENKPVIVSIGYAACHWCHVMERESFEDVETAAFMNEHFVCIKVDREERPDVDQLYMQAVQAITGSGGWPLNVFATPDRIPFYGGTYFPPRPIYNRASWMQILQQIHQIWVERRDEVVQQTEQMIGHLRQISIVGTTDTATWDKNTAATMSQAILAQADTRFGGFGRAPKFPSLMTIRFLLEHYQLTKDEASLKQALLSLDAMINGGIYDQLGGGIARYSTDDQWLVPHFEKMLYDNALLILALTEAWQITKSEEYQRRIRQTISFVERELKDPAGGYYSAIDADSEGEEGLFYTWTWEEWREAVVAADPAVADYFGVSKEGNWEGRNILNLRRALGEVATAFGEQTEALAERVKQASARLWEVREQRVRPLTDDKVLLSWNALYNLALTRAGLILRDRDYQEKAAAHLQWLWEEFYVADGLKHTWKNGEARIMANLEDYAYLIRAMAELGSVSGMEEWMLKAASLLSETDQHFMDEEGQYYYYTSDLQHDIPVRLRDMYDHALPSANAVQAENLLILGLCMEESARVEQALSMLGRMSGVVRRYPVSFGYWASLMQRVAFGIHTVIFTGPLAEEHRDEMLGYYQPQLYLITSRKQISELPVLQKKHLPGDSLIFVCSLQACYAPVSKVKKAFELLDIQGMGELLEGSE